MFISYFFTEPILQNNIKADYHIFRIKARIESVLAGISLKIDANIHNFLGC